MAMEEASGAQQGVYDPERLSSPQVFLLSMIIFLALAGFVAAILFRQISSAFATNPGLNGLILGVLAVGILLAFMQVIRLFREVRWVNSFRQGESARDPVLLAPMQAMLSRNTATSLSTSSMRSILDSIATRLDESRDISRYLIGLLVFLGLLGTFWGLIDAITSVGSSVRGLTVESDDVGDIFEALKLAILQPMDGMGTAFSSSLFGLAGSVVLGFIELQASQSQNRFYNDLEEWLSSFTRLSSGAAGGIAEGEGSVPVYVQALLEQTADSLENLQRIMARSEESRVSGNQTLLQLSERLASLTDQMRTERDLMVKLAEGQMELKPILQRIAVATEQGSGDSAADNHLRNIDVYVTRLLEETVTGRQQTVDELRSEIKVLTRTIAAIADEGR